MIVDLDPSTDRVLEMGSSPGSMKRLGGVNLEDSEKLEA